MYAKLLVYGSANAGKTFMVKNLKDAFVISYDGKAFPFPIPHIMIQQFSTLDEFYDQVEAGLKVYEKKMGKKPETIVLDTLSNVVHTLEDNCKRDFTNFKVWEQIGEGLVSISEFIQYLSENYNVVVLCHCIQDELTGVMIEPLSGKTFKKIGGFLARFDYTCYLTFNKRKREIYLKNHELARSLLDVPNQMDVNEFNIQDYLDQIKQSTSAASEWSMVE